MIIALLYISIQFQVQKDHFTTSNNETIELDGFQDDSYIKDGKYSNIVFTLCGKHAITSSNPFPDPVRKIASETNSLLVSSVPRYFGSSLFIANTSTENLRLLTIEQMLQDIVEIISQYQEKCDNNTCKVFLVGSSESADILSLFRLKYPQLSIGLWASFAVTSNPIFDYTFDESIKERLRSQSQTCLDTTQQILASLEWSINHGDQKNVYKLFNFLEDTDPRAANYMFAEMFSLLDDLPNKDGVDMFKDYCQNVSQNQEYSNFAAYFNNVIEASDYNTISFNPFNLLNTSNDYPYKNERLSWFMKCTQKGRFHISNGFRVEEINEQYFTDICIHLFNFDPDTFSFDNINITDNLYGEKNYRGTNVIFTRSENDLNHGIMPNEYKRNNVNVINLKTAGESFDLKTFNGQSLEEESVKDEIVQMAISWINDDCSSKCQHGTCVLHQCVCDDGYTGEFCDSTLVSESHIRVVTAASTLIPTIILISFGCVGWFILMRQDQNSKIII